MSNYQSSSSSTAGTSYYYPTPTYEHPAPPRRKSRSHAPRSSRSGLAHSTYHNTQHRDSATVTTPITPLNAQEPIPRTSINVLLGNGMSLPLSYDVTKPPNTAFVFSESQQKYKQISLHKSKQPVLINPTQRTYTLEFEHPTVGRQFISTFEPSGTVLSLLSGIYQYFQEKLSAPEFAMLSQMGDVYRSAQMSMRARLGQNRTSNDGVRKVDFLEGRVILQGVELELDGRGCPSVLLIKLATRSG